PSSGYRHRYEYREYHGRKKSWRLSRKLRSPEKERTRRRSTMNNEEISALLERRYAATQRPLGRLLLRLRVQQQRLRALWLAQGMEGVKRGFDIVASLGMLVLLSPLFALIALLVQLEDRGPVFFAQVRVGK